MNAAILSPSTQLNSADLLIQKKIATLRQQAGLDYCQLSKKSGISVTTLWNWENGTRPVPEKWLPQLAEGLGVTVQELTGVEEESVTLSTTGNSLRYYRELEGLTQEQLGEELGLTRTNITNWELCRQGIPTKYVAQLCRRLNVTKEGLFAVRKKPVHLKLVPNELAPLVTNTLFSQLLCGISDLNEAASKLNMEKDEVFRKFVYWIKTSA